MAKMAKITPWLWFDDQAEEAAQYYTSIFENSKILEVTRYGPGGARPEGMVMTVLFELEGSQFAGLNGGPHFQFTEAVSFQVQCQSQDEVDRLWGALTAEGEEGPCGWLKDKYGLSWQIVPEQLLGLVTDPDPKRSAAATQAMMSMKKLDLAAIEAAADRA